MNALNDLTTEIRFRERMRGYDFEEVDSYVKAVGRALAHGRDQISELQQRLAHSESHTGSDDGVRETREMLLRTLVLAQRTADAAVSEARSEAKSITGSAQERAAKTVAEAESAANARLLSSEERAAQTLAEAEENCQLILAEAKRTAATELATERARKVEEIQSLEATRAELEAATAAVQARLENERSQLRGLSTSLQSFIEQFEAVPDPGESVEGIAEPDGSAYDMEFGETRNSQRESMLRRWRACPHPTPTGSQPSSFSRRPATNPRTPRKIPATNPRTPRKIPATNPRTPRKIPATNPRTPRKIPATNPRTPRKIPATNPRTPSMARTSLPSKTARPTRWPPT